ncbi:FAD-dependent monooxygenase [Henriciella sp.]|uniref:FAD-dependent monooxygenase n=1 Tax=Henriciella sp. TaxID=1968823 RepID=UPI00262E35D2|nr:FAD-dependent monooxygenase [Henriciella sp.]
MHKISTDVLIVGAGASGLAATIFLCDLGIDTLTIERHPSTSHLPKAHYLNQRTMEIFRHHDAAEDIYSHAAPRENLGRIRWMTSLGGDGPLDRIKIAAPPIMGGGSLRAVYDSKGVTPPTNIPQIRLEPVLRHVAETRRPGCIKFRHALVELEQNREAVLATIKDLESDELFQVETKYLISADGGKTIGQALGVEMLGEQGLGDFFTIWFQADLSRYLDEDDIPMRRIFHPEEPHRIASLLAFGPTKFDRHSEEWASSFTRGPRMLSSDSSVDASDEELIRQGLDILKIDVPVNVKGVSRWSLETVIAERFSQGRVFLIGDAAHRHPPGAGLGANSGFQDAHNLCWKLALVLRGMAAADLMKSYEAERRPVIEENIAWSMNAMTNAFVMLAALGVVPGEDATKTCERFAAMMSDTKIGASRRAQLEEILGVQRVEYAAHDMEMGFCYNRGALVDDGSPTAWRDPMGSDYRPSSRPGCRLPHAWLVQDGEAVSTHDLIPLGGFLLITGAEGGSWCYAADRLAAETGLTIQSVRVGEGGDVSDPSGAWSAVREIEADGALLVRPDGHVAFRARNCPADPVAALGSVLEIVLGKGVQCPV